MKMRVSTKKAPLKKPPSPRIPAATGQVSNLRTLHLVDQVPQVALHNIPPPNGNSNPEELNGRKKKKPRNLSDEKLGTARMDLMFLVIFPCFFLVFNFVYWFSFLYVFPD